MNKTSRAHQTGGASAVGVLALLFILVLPLPAQQAPADLSREGEITPDEHAAAGADTDPTKPVSFSVRDEYYDLGGELWQNLVMLRTDRLLLERTELPGHARGVITRFDLPVVSFHNAAGTTNGLGDLYAQALVLPRIRPTFLMAYGLGLSLPTASEDTLGRGKWIAAPAVAPVWLFPRKGLLFVKLQDWISLAGASDRADVHYLTVTPTFLWRLSRRWWTVLDAESTTDWERDSQMSARTGVLLGYMVSPRVGVSVKAEQYFGDHRQAHWAAKSVLFVTRF